MDEIITRWATDLSKYQKEFKSQAAKVAEWDRLLVENGEKIQKLYTSTYEAEKASNEIERQLSGVESQQDELTAWLDQYEAQLEELFKKQQLGSGSSSGEQKAANDGGLGPDQERERTYKLAEKLTDRLDEMGKDLTKMIKEINDMSGSLSKGSKPDDPVCLFLSFCLLPPPFSFYLGLVQLLTHMTNNNSSAKSSVSSTVTSPSSNGSTRTPPLSRPRWSLPRRPPAAWVLTLASTSRMLLRAFTARTGLVVLTGEGLRCSLGR